MRVGVTCAIEYSVFSSGLTNMSLAIAELFKGLGHSVKLINMRGTRTCGTIARPSKRSMILLTRRT